MSSVVRTGALEVLHDFSPRRVGATTAYGVIFGVTNITSVISMMALVFRGDLAYALPLGIGIGLFSSMIERCRQRHRVQLLGHRRGGAGHHRHRRSRSRSDRHRGHRPTTDPNGGRSFGFVVDPHVDRAPDRWSLPTGESCSVSTESRDRRIPGSDRGALPPGRTGYSRTRRTVGGPRDRRNRVVVARRWSWDRPVCPHSRRAKPSDHPLAHRSALRARSRWLLGQRNRDRRSPPEGLAVRRSTTGLRPGISTPC